MITHEIFFKKKMWKLKLDLNFKSSESKSKANSGSSSSFVLFPMIYYVFIAQLLWQLKFHLRFHFMFLLNLFSTTQLNLNSHLFSSVFLNNAQEDIYNKHFHRRQPCILEDKVAFVPLLASSLPFSFLKTATTGLNSVESFQLVCLYFYTDIAT